MDIIKKTIPVALIIAASGVFSAVSAQVEEISARGPIPFAAFDKDGNGLVSEQEFNSVRGQRISTRAAEGRPMPGAAGSPFSEFDRNADGQLTQDELAAGRNSQIKKCRNMGMGPGGGMGQGRGMRPGRGMGRNMPAYSEFDLDGDGKMTEKEFNEARASRISERANQGYPMRNSANAPPFSNIDTNADGAISAEEFSLHQAQHRQQMQKYHEMRMQQGRGKRRGMGPGRGMGRNMPTFSEFDLNGDGKIPEKEFNEARASRISERAKQGYPMRNIANAPPFSNIDTNGDGVISEQEFYSSQSQHRQQRGQY